MARWLLLAVASTLCADTGAGRAARYSDADYSAARMPHYDTLNYDTHTASPHAEDYRDRSPDVAAPDYNHYDQEPSDKKNPKILLDEDSYHMPHETNLRKELTTMADDVVDSEYSFKSEDTNSNIKYNNKRPRKRNNIEEIGPFARRSNVGRDAKKYQRMDDEDTEVPSEHFEVDKNLGPDIDKSKFVRRDISQKVRRKSRDQAAFRDPDYDDQSAVRQGKDRVKVGESLYSDPEFSQNAPNVDNIGANRVAPVSRPPGYKTIRDDIDDTESPASREPSRFKAPMPKSRKKSNEYVDYNDMSRIEKIKNLSSRRPPDADTSSSVTPGSAAERELQALLGRKDAAAAGLTQAPAPLPSLRPDSADPYHEAQWTQFVISNRTPRPQLSVPQIRTIIIFVGTFIIFVFINRLS